MSIALFSAPQNTTPVVDVEKARYVAGTLALLMDVVGNEGVLGMVLRQARNEVVSLIPDQKPVITRKKIIRRAA